MNRERPALAGTSRLSPHLHFGEIGPGQIWRAVFEALEAREETRQAYPRQIAWREFAYHLLVHHLESTRQPLRPESAAFRGSTCGPLPGVEAGPTGYPLVEADLATNTSGWQWVAECGPDAAPHFRIFNPTVRAEKLDRAGDYIRRWVPKLAQGAGVPPIVEHAEARNRALAAPGSIKGLPK